ncbi:MAG: hypothetical protein HY000_05320 [Planctomycetes bacterium]|nr:hypothetical protein [Planctomycetota bacterium]
MPQRQEVVNVLLAQLLQERELIAAPEQVLRLAATGTRLPDVLVDFQGLRLAIEAEYATAENAKKAAYDKASQRVEQGIAHIGMAVVYPSRLRTAAFARLRAELAKAPLLFTIVTESDVTDGFLFTTGKFERGTLDDLIDSLRRSYEQLVKDETLERAVQMLETHIETFITALAVQPATTQRLAQALGVRDPGNGHNGGISKALKASERLAVNRISALILVNALIFQEVLSQKDARARPLQQLRGPDILSSLRDHWRFILDEINYYPIFYTACELILCLAADEAVNRAVESLVDTALRVVGWRASLRHDLAGRIYHRLLEEAKYLGAYYTSIPAAALLLKLALRADAYPVDWSDLNQLRDLRIADLACGTGTLLMAAADVVVDNYLRACVERGLTPDLPTLHHTIVENIIYGYDVLPSAVHLTASTLSSRVPETPINVTHLYRLPLGGPQHALGSLEFLENPKAVGTLFGEQQQVLGRETATARSVALPQMDLCAMNPPFVSSRQPNLLFGHILTRAEMQKKLKRVVRGLRLSASITSGLGAIFVALADRYVAPRGRIALVLPRAVLSGVAWKKIRDLFAEHYDLECLITSHEPKRWNFSENTNLSEVLVLGTKTRQRNREPRTVCVNLWFQPRNAVEALSVARSLLDAKPPDAETGQGSLAVTVGERKVGEAVSISWRTLRGDLWNFPCSFAQSELLRAFYHLRSGNLYLPVQGPCGRIRLCPLRQLGDLGPDPRDIYDGFNFEATSTTEYPAFWGHDAQRVTTMEQKPARCLEPLHRARPGRPLRKVTDLWPKAARVLIVQRPRLNTKRLAAVRVSRKVLADVWWPFALSVPRSDTVTAEKALVLWFNSTLGLLLLLGHREETEGAWVQFKKPVLGQLPVLDVSRLTKKQQAKLVEAYDRLANQALLPFPEMASDGTRAAIDEAVARALEIPEFTILRELLAREPIICLSLDRLMPEGI